MMYDREHAPGELKLRFHIRNKRGEDVLGALRYDPATGQGFKRDIYGNAVEFFVAGGYVDIDGHTNPIKEELDAIYTSARAHLSQDIQSAVVNKVIEDSRKENTKENATTTTP